MKIAVLGLGEAGKILAEGFANQGQTVSGFDPASVVVAGSVHRANSATAAVKDADLILSLVTARWAATSAREVASSLKENALFVDLNAGSGKLMQELSQIFSDSGSKAKFVDGAVIGSVRQFAEKVSILLAGPEATAAAKFINDCGGNAEPISTEIGAASNRKLLRSVFMKGLGALISEAMEAGRLAGEEEWVRLQIVNELAGGESTRQRLESGTQIHAARRGKELSDVISSLQQYKPDWPVSRGAANYHHYLATTQREDELFSRLREIPTAAIGDGSDRLGFTHSTIKPIWDAPRLVGRALTVQTHGGDNLGVHAAIKVAKPGDVLVVSADGFTERALMGELVANRAINKGILGFITDGAVRDRNELASLGFPVWAAGQVPAGPYKNGPFRVRGQISIGGVVCNNGDFVVADGDGVCFIKPEDVDQAIANGYAVIADEAKRMESILSARK